MCRDHHGNAVHLFERECSIQRRNQKLIEQTPSPVVDEAKREEIGELVVKAAEAVNYTNLGTAEFLEQTKVNFTLLRLMQDSK